MSGDRKAALTLAGATYAAEHGSDVLSRAASKLFLLADVINNTDEDAAGSTRAMWVDAVTFIAHGLTDGHEFINHWLHPRVSLEPANDSGSSREGPA